MAKRREEMISRLEKLESEIANGIMRGEDADKIRRNLTQYNVPGEFWEIHDRLIARRDPRVLVRDAEASEEDAP